MPDDKELQDLTNVLWAVREIRFMLLEWYPEKSFKSLGKYLQKS